VAGHLNGGEVAGVHVVVVMHAIIVVILIIIVVVVIVIILIILITLHAIDLLKEHTTRTNFKFEI
jgi:hypothetical protein